MGLYEPSFTCMDEVFGSHKASRGSTVSNYAVLVDAVTYGGRARERFGDLNLYVLYLRG